MFKLFGKSLAVLAAAGLMLVAPTVIPQFPNHSANALIVRCGVPAATGSFGSAYAAAGIFPCPAPASAGSPWPVVVVFVGVASVIVNAAYIWNTQCRELTSDEAMTSTFLPFVGIALDKNASKCH